MNNEFDNSSNNMNTDMSNNQFDPNNNQFDMNGMNSFSIDQTDALNDVDHIDSFDTNNYYNGNNDVNLNSFNNMQNDMNMQYYPNSAYGNGYNMGGDFANMNPNYNMNNYNSAPQVPQDNQSSNKKKKNNFSLILIIILVCGLIGGGIFFYLSTAKNKTLPVEIETKDLDLELGETIDKSVDTYATIKNTDSKNCSIDLSKIEDKEGTYEYEVKCGSVSKKGKVTMKDTKAPVVVLKEVTTYVGGTYTPEDFIDTCADASTCSYEFSSENAASYANQEGVYEIGIVVSDENGNKTTENAKLTVSGTKPTSYLSCTKVDDSDKKISITQTDKIGFANGNFSKISYRIVSLKFSKKEDYIEIKSNYENDKTYKYKEYSGYPGMNDDTLTITFNNSLSASILNSEAGGSFPIDFMSVRKYYLNKGYQCVIGG